MRQQHTKDGKYFFLVCSLFLLIGGIVGAMHVASMKAAVNFMMTEIQHIQSFSPIHIPSPSAVLLFGMGLFGIICVHLNEKRRRQKSSGTKTH